MKAVLPILVVVLLAAVSLPMVSGSSDASVTMDSYAIEAYEEVSGSSVTTRIDCMFYTNDSDNGFRVDGCSCGVYNDRSCSDVIIAVSGTSSSSSADISYSIIGDDDSDCGNVVVNFAISGSLETVYVKFTSSTDYWIYEVVINEAIHGSETTSNLSVTSAHATQMTYSSSAYSFMYEVIFDGSIDDYDFAVSLYSDADLEEVISENLEYAKEYYDYDYPEGILFGGSTTDPDFYISVSTNNQNWKFHLVFTTADGEEVSEGSEIVVETNEIVELDTTTSLIFDSAETVTKVLMVLGVVVLVAFVVFGFGLRR